MPVFVWIFLKQFCLKGSEAPESSETSESNIGMSSVPITLIQNSKFLDAWAYFL